MRLLSFFLLIVAVAGGTGLWQWNQWQTFVAAPVNPDSALNLWVAPGTSYAGLVRELEIFGLIQANWRWRVWGRIHQPEIKAGEYQVEPDKSLEQLMSHLAAGRVREHRLTIVEGWTVDRLRRELAEDPRLVSMTKELDSDALMHRLGCEGCSAEGRFLPETYFFNRGSSDLDILTRAYQAMNQTLAEAWAERSASSPAKTPEELLVLASLIERETGQQTERARVAGVFARRLKIGMRLQTDPTVIYGLGEDFDGRLRRIHLRTDHPWNTYTRHGLPPTPIALPGRDSLRAAARPAEGSALYFVSRGDGTHQFSDTLEEHNAAVNRYIRGR